jgi:hypothetical protein
VMYRVSRPVGLLACADGRLMRRHRPCAVLSGR